MDWQLDDHAGPSALLNRSDQGQIESIIWRVPQYATTFNYWARIGVINDGIAETGEWLEAQADLQTRSTAFGPVLTTEARSNEVKLSFVDNTPPDFAQSTTTRQLDENTPRFRNFGSPVSATDPDGHALVYTLSGQHAAYFDIRDDTGQLQTRRVFDYESGSSYEVVVTASDPPGGTDAIGAVYDRMPAIESFDPKYSGTIRNN